MLFAYWFFASGAIPGERVGRQNTWVSLFPSTLCLPLPLLTSAMHVSGSGAPLLYCTLILNTWRVTKTLFQEIGTINWVLVLNFYAIHVAKPFDSLTSVYCKWGNCRTVGDGQEPVVFIGVSPTYKLPVCVDVNDEGWCAQQQKFNSRKSVEIVFWTDVYLLIYTLK